MSLAPDIDIEPIKSPKTPVTNQIQVIIEEKEKLSDQKPPAYPLAILGPNNGYSVLNQKKREFYQRVTRHDKAPMNSPKLSSPKIDNQRQSPFPSPKQAPPPIPIKLISKTPTSTLITHPSTNNNLTLTNFKYNENFYRDFQFTKFQNDTNTELNPTNNEKPLRLNCTDPGINENAQIPKTVEQFNLTRIPLSPKSTLQMQKNYFSPKDKQVVNINGVEQISLRRPFSANTSPSSTINDTTNTNLNLNFNSQKQSRLTFLNSNQLHSPTTNNNLHRVLSADNVNRNNKNQV